MRNAFWLLVIMFICAAPSRAQHSSQRVIYVTADPPTACAPGKLITNSGLLIKKVWLGLSDGTCQPVATTVGASIPTIAQGDLLYGSAVNTLVVLNKNATASRYLSNSGSSNNPAWAQVDLSNGVTGQLNAANIGGGGVSTAEFDFLGSITSNVQTQIDSKQSTITFGTGVQTALGVNVGSAGAPVLFNGALGSPSSAGTIPAFTLSGTIAGGGNQLNNIIIGTTTPLAGFHTTLSATTSFATPIIGPTADSTTALKITKADLSTVVGVWDTTNARLRIGSGVAPTVALDVTGAGVFSSSLTSAGVTSTGAVVAGVSNGLGINGRSWLFSSADGNFYVTNNGVSGFTRFMYGGTTNSFAAVGFDAVNGFSLQSAAGTATWNDASTAGSGTVANRYLFGIAAPTLTATNSSVTNTVASTFYIGGAPTDSTNTTSTTKWALLVAAGGSKLGGAVFVPSLTTSAGVQTAVLCQASTGEMIADSVACLASSGRFKEGVQPLRTGLNEILALRPVSFFYKPEGIFAKNANFQRERVGLIAEDVAHVDPRLVGYESDGVTPRTVGYEQIVPILINAVKELNAKIGILESEIKTLKANSQ